MKKPLQHLADQQGIHYRLQLNCYRFLLEKYYAKEVAAMFVVCVHPDNSPQAFVDSVPILHEETRAIMKIWEHEACRSRSGDVSGGSGYAADLPQDVLLSLATCFTCPDYLQRFQACSRSCRRAVLDPTAWQGQVIDMEPQGQALEFPEAYDVGKLRANQARAAQHANEGLLLMVLKPALDKKAQKKGRGKLTDAEFATMEDLRKKAQKVKDMRELWDTLADESRESREPLRRRLPNKGADPQRHAAINNGMMQRVVSYSLTPGVAMRGRRYVRGWGAQRMTREIQECLLPHTVDLDIHNCCFVLLKQLFEKLNLGALIPAELNEVLVRCADSRASVCTEDLGVSPARGIS